MKPSEMYTRGLSLKPGECLTAKFSDEQERETFKVGLYRARMKEGNTGDLVIHKGFNSKAKVYWISLNKPVIPTEFTLTTSMGEERRLVE